MRFFANATQFVCLACLCGLLAACAPTQQRSDIPEDPRAILALENEGQYAQAARAWLALAEREPQRALQHRLRAADAWLAAGRPAAVDAALDPLRGLDASEQIRVDLRRAQAALAEDHLQRAVALMTVAEQDIPEQDALRFYQVRAQVSERNGDYLAAARDHHQAAQLQIGLEREKARAELFRSLGALPAAELERLASTWQHDEDFGPWIELAFEVKNSLLSGTSIDEAVRRFGQRHPAHPAAGQLSQTLVSEARQRFRRPEQIAVLLPNRGRFASAAESIRDGIMHAWYSSADERPTIRFYDSGEQPQTATSAFRSAVSDGADIVLGPLDRDAVNQLQRLPERAIPVLALNHPGNDLPPSGENAAPPPVVLDQPSNFGSLFASIALNPETEASQAAILATQLGKRRALLLISDDTWGHRMLEAFTAEFERLGGQIAEIRYFQPNETNHDAPVRELMGLGKSQQRYQRVRQLAGRSLAFEPIARQDADFIFMAARAGNARLLSPLVRFHRGGHLPIIATAAIHDTSRGEADSDLNGIMFCDAPWVLDGSRQSADQMFAGLGGGARLFALGMDSYRLLPYLDWLATHQGERFPGASGELSIDRQGQVQRELPCARFQSGHPRLMQSREQLGT